MDYFLKDTIWKEDGVGGGKIGRRRELGVGSGSESSLGKSMDEYYQNVFHTCIKFSNN